MAKPDFSTKDKDTLAKRAAFICSNPSCRASTIGPNDDAEKATSIGEAAHIHAARETYPRFVHSMTDAARAEITNGIWLCRNCHREIDQNGNTYPAELLFAWREAHEIYVKQSLGKKYDPHNEKLLSDEILQFEDYPPIVRRIVIDKPRGWELRLSAELLKYLNRDHFRQMRDLREGLYTKPKVYVAGLDAPQWVDARTDELVALFTPLGKILENLTASWGRPGEAGDLDDIHHHCKLLSNALERVIEHEEFVHFAALPEHYQPVQQLLMNNALSQAEKFMGIPAILDTHVELCEQGELGVPGKPNSAEHTIEITLPDSWAENINSAMSKASRVERGEKAVASDDQSLGFFGWVGIFAGMFLLLLLL
jgi:hypothetical protein